eukprot:PITA_20053
MFSLLDCFSGYNQVLVAESDRLKTNFRTKWGTFAYRRMLFRLVNVGTTFQRTMDIAFRRLIGQSMVWEILHILDYAQIVKPMKDMVKKDVVYNWGKKEKYAFARIKQTIAEAPALYSPDFKKDFLLYTFASDNSLAAVLTQKDEANDEHSISFMSASMQGPKLNYPTIDKQAYAIYKAVKHFKPYLLKNHCIVFVPHPTVCTC